MADAKRDDNRVPTLLAVSSSDGTTPVRLYADPTSHRLLVDLGSTSGYLKLDQTTPQTVINGAPLFNVGLKSPKIYPSADGTTAVGIFKADGVTNILNVDTTNSRIGIGTTAPQSKLDIEGSLCVGATYSGTTAAPANGLLVEGNAIFGATANLASNKYLFSGTESSMFAIQNTAGSSTTAGAFLNLICNDGAAIASSHRLGVLAFSGSLDNSNTLAITASITAFAAETFTGTTAATDIAIFTTPATTITRAEIARFTSTGRLGIGTTAPSTSLAFGGLVDRNISVERHTTASTSGSYIALKAGGAVLGGTDLAGGDAFIYSGISTGTGTSNIRFYTPTAGSTGTTDNAPTEKMRLTGAGYLGIGTTAPTDPLVIKPAAGSGLQDGLLLLDSSSGSGEGLKINWQVSDHANIDLAYIACGSQTNGGSLRFATNAADSGSPTERMRIMDNGYVGVNTTAPTNLFHVDGDGTVAHANVAGTATALISTSGASAGLRMATFNDAAGAASYNLLVGIRGRGTTAIPTAPQTDDYILGIVSNAYDTTVSGGQTAGIFFIADENVTAGHAKQRISLLTSETDNTARVERLTIKPDGNVGVGITPTATLHIKAGSATAGTAPLKFTSGTLLTNPEAGAIEFLTDKYYATITTGATRKEIQLYSAYYGEMYMYENATAETIDTNNVYKAVRNYSTGAVSGFTFSAGSTGPIASVANYAGTVPGTVLITDVAHGLVTGNIITIGGTTDYNGTFSVTRVDNDTFYITETYTSSQTGNWYKPSSLTADTGSAGTYRISWNITADSAASGETYKVEANKNVTALDNIASERNFATGADYGQLTAGGLVTLADGDVVWLSFKQTSAGTDSLTIRHSNFNLTRI